MTNEDHAFHKDQTSQRVGKCVDDVIPLSTADRQIFRRLQHSQPQSKHQHVLLVKLHQYQSWNLAMGQILVQHLQINCSSLLFPSLFRIQCHF